MQSAAPSPPGFGHSTVRLVTLIRIRWLAIAGQSAAVLGVRFGLGFDLPTIPCLLLIACSVIVNIALKARFPGNVRLTAAWAMGLLAYDIVQLAALVYFTGGLNNPFSFLLLAPVMVSATILPPQRTLALGGLAALAATVLVLVHWPLPWREPAGLDLPPLYLAGVWAALVLSLAFMGVYAFQVADEARKLADALAATELVMAREHHLNALDGLAAAAAHELGTPLATIALVARELEREVPAGSDWSEDIELLRTQSERCRAILAKLRSLSSDPDQHFARMSVSDMIEEVVEPHRGLGVDIHIDLPTGDPLPRGKRNPAILYGIGNLVENAVDFAASEVSVTARWDDRAVTLTVADDGPGFPSGVIDRIGEPYLSSRRRADGRDIGTGGGLGLGVFIAKTLLERSGAQLQFANRRAPDSGARVDIVWPRSKFESSSAGFL